MFVYASPRPASFVFACRCGHTYMFAYASSRPVSFVFTCRCGCTFRDCKGASTLNRPSNFCRSTSSDLVTGQKLIDQVVQPIMFTFMWYFILSCDPISHKKDGRGWVCCVRRIPKQSGNPYLHYAMTRLKSFNFFQLFWSRLTYGRLRILAEQTVLLNFCRLTSYDSIKHQKSNKCKQ